MAKRGRPKKITTDIVKVEKKRSNKPYKEKTVKTKLKVIDVYEKSLCNVTATCKAVGINRSTFYEYYNNDIEFKKQIDELENVVIDFVENKLLECVNNNNIQSIMYYLKNKAKKRGYSDKQEIDMNINEVIRFDFGEEINEE